LDAKVEANVPVSFVFDELIANPIGREQHQFKSSLCHPQDTQLSLPVEAENAFGL